MWFASVLLLLLLLQLLLLLLLLLLPVHDGGVGLKKEKRTSKALLKLDGLARSSNGQPQETQREAVGGRQSGRQVTETASPRGGGASRRASRRASRS